MASNTFVRKSFYIKPPSASATAEEWAEWAENDDRKARVAKAKYTRACNKEMPISVDTMPAMTVAKVNGAYRQVAAVGFVGSAEDGTTQIEPMVAETQEKDIDTARQVIVHRSAGSRKSRTKNRREARREKKKARYQ